MKQIVIAGLILSFMGFQAKAQENPELIKITESAAAFISKGDYGNAAAMYTQAVRMAPDNVALRRDLAYVYFLDKNYDRAKEIITPVLNSSVADEQTFQIAAAVENASGKSAKARKIVNSGLQKFPNSGLLHNYLGNLVVGASKNGNDALKAWNKGIAVDPSYPMNYYNAANAYFHKKEMVWALIYAETYANLDPYSAKTGEMKKLVYEAYQKVFAPSSDSKVPEFSGVSNDKAHIRFEQAFMNVLNSNISTVSEGFNVESIGMLRTRFITNWQKNYSKTFPLALLDYQNKLIRSGHYIAYNQWLLGATESSQGFSEWVNQNMEAYRNFEVWMKNNPLKPNSEDVKPEK